MMRGDVEWIGVGHFGLSGEGSVEGFVGESEDGDLLCFPLFVRSVLDRKWGARTYGL